MIDDDWIVVTPDMFPAEFSPELRQSLATELLDEEANGTAYAYRDGKTGRLGVFLPLQQFSIPLEMYPLCRVLRSLERMLASLDMAKGGAR